MKYQSILNPILIDILSTVHFWNQKYKSINLEQFIFMPCHQIFFKMHVQQRLF